MSRARTLSLVAFAASVAWFAACSSDDNPQPNTDFTTSSAVTGSTTTATSTAGSGGGATSTTGTTSSTGGQGGDGGGGGSAGGGGGAGGGGPDCEGPNDCYDCTPTNDLQYLNHCTDSQCVPFDNEARLTNYNHGNLPPLP